MPETLDDKVSRLRQELRLANQGKALWNTLLEKRTLIESIILQMENDLEKETLDYYRKGIENTEDISRMREKLHDVRATRRQVDEKLDEYEAMSVELEEKLQEELVKTILERFPDRRSAYEALIHQQNVQCKKNALNDLLIEATKKIKEHVSSILYERKKATPRGFLAGIFGGSPAVSILKSLESLKPLSSQVLKTLEETLLLAQKGGNQEDVYKALQKVTQELQEVMQQQWTYSKIEKAYSPIASALDQCQKDLEGLKAGCKNGMDQAKSSLTEWLYS